MIQLRRIEEICSRFPGKRLLVYGDVILDHYVFGHVERISPEAPVPVVHVQRDEFRLGGAGNVAVNIDRLGGRGLLLGLAGCDGKGAEIARLKDRDNLLLRLEGVETVVKMRIISGRQQIARLDRERPLRPDEATEKALIGKIADLEPQLDGIIVSDYAKGTVTPTVLAALRQVSQRRRIPLVVDPKPVHAAMYGGASGITPNIAEAEEMLKCRLESEEAIRTAVGRLRQKFKTDFVIITRGGAGISAGQKRRRVFHLPAFSHEVFDVTGAGDTVVAVLTLALIAGADLREAVALANAAASLVVEHVGTYQASVEELIERAIFIRKNPVQLKLNFE